MSTQTSATNVKPRNSNPFTPASTAVNTTSPSQSARPVILPHIPELYIPLEQALDALLPRASLSTAASTPAPVEPKPDAVKPSPFMDALRDVANRTTTDNSAPAYKSTLSPTLDVFASLSQATDHKDIGELLSASWHADPACTLRIIWNLRSIHEGKSARQEFYIAYAWLYTHHPRTAVANLRFLIEPTIKRTIKRKAPAEGQNDEDAVMVSADPEKDDETSIQEIEVRMPHGYWKDLLNILLLATLDQLHPTSDLSALHVYVPKEGRRDYSRRTKSKENNKESARVRDEQIAEQAKVSRLEKHRHWHTVVEQKLAGDKAYRALYVTVARLFAEGLARDLNILREIADEKTPTTRRIELAFDLTLVGKWAPSIGASHDRVTSIATPIAELLYAGGHLKLPAAPLEQPLTQETAHRLRSAYARWVTAPLRRVLQVPEVAMSAGQWDTVNYSRVPSHSMRANQKHFVIHDKERFLAYLLKVAQGKASISGATLLPNKLLQDAIVLSQKSGDSATEVQVVEAQWTSLVERIRESGTLPNALAVCDVSGSMGALGHGSDKTPIGPAVALSIILAQVARPPWAHSFITFSQTPELVMLDPKAGLVETANKMVQTSWGYNTDFNAIFTKLILPTAIEFKVKPEEMVQRLFVFSDMQFDASRGRNQGEHWETEHQKIKAAFEKAGYTMPEIVYWNLAGSVAKPITKDDEGVALVSGFSPGMLKVFLEQGELEVGDKDVMVQSKDGEDSEYDEVTQVEKKRLDPIDTMLKALGKESFAGLEVFD